MKVKRKKDDVVESIEKHSEIPLPSEDSRVEFLNTGSTLLNLAISGKINGGWARGRVNNVVADRSSGKCEKNSYILTEKGMIKIDDIIPDAKEGSTELSQIIYGFDNKDKTSVFYKEKVDKTIYIETKHGFEKEATECHPIMTWDSNNHSFVLKKMSEINIGDFIVIKKGMNFFPDNPFSFLNNYKKKRKSYMDFTIPNEMSNELAKILGYIVADGNIIPNCITISNSRDYIKSDIQSLLAKLGISIDVCKNRVNIGRIEFRDFIFSLFDSPEKFTARFKFAPKCVLQSTKENQAHFLQALFDCDGYLSNNSNLEYYSASFELVKQVQAMLLNFGVFSTLNKKWNKKYQRFYFTIRIPFDDTQVYEKEIGSLKYIFSQRHSKKSMFSVPNLLPKIWKDIECAREKFGWSKNGRIKGNKRFPNYRNTSRIGNCTHREIKKIIGLFDNYMDLSFYKSLLNFHFSPVVKKEINNKETFVYDFVIPKNHLFWSGGMISHNTLISLDTCANAFYTIKNTKSKIFPRIRNVNIVYDNVEGVMDFKLEQMYGKDFVDSVEWIRSGTCEEFGRNYLSRVKNLGKGDFLLYVIDSIDALISQAGRERMEKSLSSNKDEESTYGTEKAKYLSNKFFGNCCDLMQNKDATLLCVSQVRENLNAGMFGKKHYRVGGKAMDFYTHVVVWLYNAGKLKATVNGREMIYGASTIAKIEKNKCGIAHRNAEFNILYNNGISYIDDLGSIIKFLNPKSTAKQCEEMLSEFYDENGVFIHKKYEDFKLLAERDWMATEKKLSEKTKRPNKFELLGI